MTNSVQFNVGDRVVCIDGFERGFDGEEGVITGIWKGRRDINKIVLQVKFDCSDRLKEWYSNRFQVIEDVPYSPICRKIRQMEERWERFQDRKKASKLYSYSCGNTSTYVTLDEAVTVTGTSIYAALDHRF